jgi:Flp pilus assembly pilin Flp
MGLTIGIGGWGMLAPPPLPRTAQAGQGLVEYGLILVLVVIVAIVSLAFFGTTVSGMLSMIASSV